MNFVQRFGLFILIAITITYIYFSYFNKDYSNVINNTEKEVSYNPIKDTAFFAEKNRRKMKFLDTLLCVSIALLAGLLMTRLFANLLMPITGEEPALYKLNRLEVEE